MEEQGFIDVWTPSMTLGTPEGARDFLVPVRLQPGIASKDHGPQTRAFSGSVVHTNQS